MTDTNPPSLPHALTTLTVGDDPAAWANAGFEVQNDRTQIDHVTVHLTGADGARGITSVGITDIAAEMDGLPMAAEAGPFTEQAQPHPNGINHMDHLVVMTPNCDRTTQVFEAAGLQARRARVFGKPERQTRQTFFWIGRTILELVGPDVAGDDDSPATAWGLALVAPDLDAMVASLGQYCSPAKTAVQPGRRIATIKTKDLGISVPLAVLTPHTRQQDERQ